MPILGWRVHFTRRQLTMPVSRRPLLQGLPMDAVSGWLEQQGIAEGAPFLLSPDGRYDVELNSYFRLNPAPESTQAAIALGGRPECARVMLLTAMPSECPPRRCISQSK
jgi:hypothetical protein